jgi:hypothetical protein
MIHTRVFFTTRFVSNKITLYVNTLSNLVLSIEPYIPILPVGRPENVTHTGSRYIGIDPNDYNHQTDAIEVDITNLLNLPTNKIWVEKYNKGYYPPKEYANPWFFDYRIVTRSEEGEQDLVRHFYESGSSRGPAPVGTDYFEVGKYSTANKEEYKLLSLSGER